VLPWASSLGDGARRASQGVPNRPAPDKLLTHEQDYIYERPALTFRKLRKLELASGAPKRSNPGGHSGPATPDTPAQWATEREAALQVEDRYRADVADWTPQRPPTEVT
jgi:hypothetical protein